MKVYLWGPSGILHSQLRSSPDVFEVNSVIGKQAFTNQIEI